jgi:hypothetical protein
MFFFPFADASNAPTARARAFILGSESRHFNWKRNAVSVYFIDVYKGNKVPKIPENIARSENADILGTRT